MDQLQPSAPSKKPTAIKWIARGVACVTLILFVWIYHFTPIANEFWNEQVIYYIILLASLAAAIFGTLLTLQFDKGEAPRRVWLTFTLGWWAWALGELTDIVYSFLYTDYPEFTVIDACWVLGYLFFGLSLYYQFRVIYDRKKKMGTVYFLPVAALILLITAGFTQLAIHRGLGEEWSWPGVYLAVFYPVCDLIQGAAALWLSVLFGRGRWGRPWWALICFAIADTISTWFWIGGGANLPEGTQNWIWLFSDTVYIGGYLLVALAFLSNYRLHKSNTIPLAPSRKEAHA
jgi:hypothetical protein